MTSSIPDSSLVWQKIPSWAEKMPWSMGPDGVRPWCGQDCATTSEFLSWFHTWAERPEPQHDPLPPLSHPLTIPVMP